MQLDHDHCYEAMKARDARFDGVFYVAVSTTGIYCRPRCTVRTPGRDPMPLLRERRQRRGRRLSPCLRCRPELAPGSAPVDSVRRVSGLAVARIEEGFLCDADMEDLAAEFSLSSRQLRRVANTNTALRRWHSRKRAACCSPSTC
jgi:AraC family transcriptional regulator of adaptative response / DNA-3-methyladenine glycosylase II